MKTEMWLKFHRQATNHPGNDEKEVRGFKGHSNTYSLLLRPEGTSRKNLHSPSGHSEVKELLVFVDLLPPTFTLYVFS